jgi:PAS domain S-box-containing protein
MAFDFPLYSIVFFLGGILALSFLAVYWRRHAAPGALPFSLFMLTCAVWVIASGLELGAVTLTDKVFWTRCEYLGTVSAGVLWLSFAADYSGARWWKRFPYIVLLWIIPLITLVLAWTSDAHNLLWTRIYPATNDPHSLLVYEHGPWYFLFLAYQYLTYIVGIVILLRFMLRNTGIYRRQIVLLIIGTLIPLGGSVAYVLNFSPVKGLDLIPFTFVFAGVFYAITIFRFRFLDVVPVARAAVVENLPDGTIVLNKEDRIVDMNPAGERMVGGSLTSLVGKQLALVWPRLRQTAAGLHPGQWAEMQIDKSGQPLCLETSVNPLLDRKNRSIGALFVLRDVTELKNIEQNLKESESLYSALVEQSNEGVLIIQDGLCRFANRTMAEMSGFKIEEIVGQPVDFLAAESDKAVLRERHRARVAGQEVLDSYEIRMRRPNGSEADVEVSVGSISYGGQIANIATVRDISERKSTQRKLQLIYQQEHRLRSSLQEEIDKRSKYTRALVHELKTPLTSILASSELLESEIKDEIQASLVKNIRRAALNLEQRIGELLELARGETGLLKINKIPLDLGGLIREVLSETGPVAAQKNLLLISDIPALPLVYGDKTRLRQVMHNLLSNAVKFTGKGTIVVSARSDEANFVMVQIKDTGRGIDKDQMDNLFDPYRSKIRAGEEMGGIGMGLALSKIYVDLHGGRIWAESVPGQGSSFYFSVPIYKRENENESQ